MPPIPELEAIRKAQILEAGLKTLTQKGSANVTMDDVCKAAGLSKGGLVHYYKTKRMLFDAVFEEFFKRIFQKSRDTMARHEHPMDKLLSFEWLYDDQDPDAMVGYPILLDCMALAVHDEAYRALIQVWITHWIELLSLALEQGIAEGVFSPMDVTAVAQSISAVYQGVATRWFLARETHSTPWAVDSFQKGIQGILRPHMKQDYPS